MPSRSGLSGTAKYLGNLHKKRGDLRAVGSFRVSSAQKILKAGFFPRSQAPAIPLYPGKYLHTSPINVENHPKAVFFTPKSLLQRLLVNILLKDLPLFGGIKKPGYETRAEYSLETEKEHAPQAYSSTCIIVNNGMENKRTKRDKVGQTGTNADSFQEPAFLKKVEFASSSRIARFIRRSTVFLEVS